MTKKYQNAWEEEWPIDVRGTLEPSGKKIVIKKNTIFVKIYFWVILIFFFLRN